MSDLLSLRVTLLLATLALAGGLRGLAAAIRGLDPETLALPGERGRPGERAEESGERGASGGESAVAASAPIVHVVERFVRAAHDLESGALFALVIAAMLAAGALAEPERSFIKPTALLLTLAAGIVVAPLLLVVGPERLAAGREAALLGRAVPAVLLLAAVLHPLAVVQDSLAALFALLSAGKKDDEEEEGEEEPAAPPPPPGAREAEPTTSALRQVLGFTRAAVEQVMTPRAEIVAVESGATIADLVQVVRTTRRSCYPIYRANLDDLVGWLRLTDLLGAADDAAPVDRFRRELVVVPESKPAFDLAQEMRGAGTSIVVVVDEFGTVKGLANLHDLIGALVGEVTEDEERPEFEVRRLDPHTWILNPRIRIERVNELTGLGIPEGDYQTLAGFILAQMARIPLPHERLRWRDKEFEILAADSRRIRSVRVRRRPVLVSRRERRTALLPDRGRPPE